MWNRNKNRKNKCLDIPIIEEIGKIEYFCFSFLDAVLKIEKSKLKNKTFLIKKVKDANSITKKTYRQLIIVSNITNSFPLIIAEKYNQKNILKEGVLYKLKDIYIMNDKTFENFLEDNEIYLIKKKNKVNIVKHNKEEEFLKIDDEKLLNEIEKIGFNPFNEKFSEKLKKIFNQLCKTQIVHDTLGKFVEIGCPLNFYEVNKNFFVKKVTKFDRNKEKRILKFFKVFNEKGIFIVKKGKEIIEEENAVILPEEAIKKEKKKMEELLDVFS